MRGYSGSLRNVVTRTGARPSTSGPVRFQIPSPGSGSANGDAIGGGQAAARASDFARRPA